jgi:hypothetical protein
VKTLEKKVERVLTVVVLVSVVVIRSESSLEVVTWRRLERIFLVLVLRGVENGFGVEERILSEEMDGLGKGI